MDTRTPEEVYQYALVQYNQIPDQKVVEELNGMIHQVVTSEGVMFDTHGTYAISSDPEEDNDDLIMLRYAALKTTAHLIIIVSAGYRTPHSRLEYLKKLFPCFQDVSFNVPFESGNNVIMFMEDGSEINVPLDGYLNCGPIHSRTLSSISRCLKKDLATRIVTVGAKDDCTLGAGINQKQTDEPGKLINVPDVWNTFIKENAGASCVNLSVNISRHVLIPNPLNLMDTPYKEMANELCMSSLIDNTGMFLACRPDPNPHFALRVNEGNSIIDYKYLNHDMTREDYEAGLIKLKEYMDLTKSKGLDAKIYESAAIPIMATHSFGGRYKPGKFGWAPGDETAKHSVDCLLSETVPTFKENIRRLRYLTPAYDVIAFIMLFKR
jgi:hypothetical protein